MDKELRLKRLQELHSTISKRRYPTHMDEDKALVLHALERRIFKLNGECCGLRSEPQI